MNKLAKYIKEYVKGENKGKENIISILTPLYKKENFLEIKKTMLEAIKQLEKESIEVEFKKINKFYELKKPIKFLIERINDNNYNLILRAKSKREAKKKIKELKKNKIIAVLENIELQGITAKKVQETCNELLKEEKNEL